MEDRGRRGGGYDEGSFYDYKDRRGHGSRRGRGRQYGSYNKPKRPPLDPEEGEDKSQAMAMLSSLLSFQKGVCACCQHNPLRIFNTVHFCRFMLKICVENFQNPGVTGL
jgi:hypothetical protein